MSFLNQVAKSFGNIPEFKFQAVMFGRDAFYIEGARPIKISDDEMIFKARGAVIYVRGARLSIREMTADCVSVVGAISSFEVKDV